MSLDNGSTASYQYDGLHRRIVRTEGSTTRHFYYNEKWQCLEERATESGSADRQYVWHPYYIDALAVSYNSSGDKHFYCHDANFNITAAMDSNGDVVERYHYSPYGEVTVLDADFSLDSDNVSDIGNEFLYTGRRLDPETGLQQSRYRYYHAKLGRWLTRDPIGYEGGANLYGYVEGKPISYSDPYGESFWSWVPIISTIIACTSSPPGTAVADYAGAAVTAIAQYFRTAGGAGIMVPEGGPKHGRASETAAV